MLNWVIGTNHEGWYWQVDADRNTLLAIFNRRPEAVTVAVSLDYSARGVSHSYDLPERSIPGRSTEMVDIGEVIAAGLPDEDGDVIPAGVTFGGYRVRKLGPDAEGALTTEALVLDRQRKTYLTYYNTGCCFLSPPRLNPTSLSGAVGGSALETLQLKNACTSAWEPALDPFYWSDNSGVAGIDSSWGDVALVGVGSTQLWGRTRYFKDAAWECPFVLESDNTPAQVLNVTQSPSEINMSTGDTKQITVQVQPSTVTVSTSFTTTLTSNPDSSCAATLNIPGKSGSGTIQHNVTASPAGCSGVFRTQARANNVVSSNPNPTNVRVPPQVIIQMMRGEAGLQSATGDASQPAIGVTARNRINNADFPGSTNYQNTITQQQFQGLNTTVTTGVLPELTHAVGVHTRAIGAIVENAGCFWSPTATQWGIVQQALQSGTTNSPANTGAPACYGGSPRQILVKSSVANNNRGGEYAGAPAFLFLQRRSASDSAVRQIN